MRIVDFLQKIFRISLAILISESIVVPVSLANTSSVEFFGTTSQLQTIRSNGVRFDRFLSSDRKSFALKISQGHQSTRFDSLSGERVITNSTTQNGWLLTFQYRQLTTDKFILARISSSKLHPLFNGVNSFSDVPGADNSKLTHPAGINSNQACNKSVGENSFEAVRQSCAEASHQEKVVEISSSCGERTSSINASLSSLLEPSKILACQKKFDSFSESAGLISVNLSRGSDMKISCSAEQRSHFDFPNSITLGSDIINRDGDPTSVIYHELLHSTGIQNERLDQSIVKCCVDQSVKGSCDLLAAYSRQRTLRSNSPKFNDMLEVALNSDVDDSKLAKELDKVPGVSSEVFDSDSSRLEYVQNLRAKLLKFCGKLALKVDCDKATATVAQEVSNIALQKQKRGFVAYHSSFGAMGSSPAQDGNLIDANSAANENSSNGNASVTKTNVTSSMGARAAQAGAFSKDAASSAKPATTTLVAESTEVNVGGTKAQTSSNSTREMAANLGKTSASGESSSESAKAPTRILAEEPRYTPGGASAADMRRDAQRYSAPMAKIAEQAQSYERTIAANIGWGVANAAPIKLPVSNSDGSSSTSLKSFNPTTGETTLNALDAKGHEITITSAPVSFDGAPPSFEIRNAAGGVVAQTGSYKSGAAQSRQVPKLSDAVTSETGTTRPGRIIPGLAKSETAPAQASSGASGSGFSPTSGGSLSLASTGSSGARTQPSANANRPDQPLNVKQLVMRAPYTDHQRMRSLYEKVKEADFKKYDRPEENPSVTFRYCGVNYPAKFLGKNFVNLDVPNANKAQVCRGQGRLDE